ncbi:dTDP-4-dehydrorhamnose reductase [Hyunsoonleella flava]|uniref:dTDP-4-dehydrorhamnose reductase n=1 Tax=Hyunsoonleella flava TaxID=2527939 RepID=A0A4Q9FA14_9FLAO|nr:dTDP-4-dehydrorhamnose reductase [Hyunsoonleella flava]TBN00189.1 dTDP-4-dehydrorhamnose reductase [Hyunsoonleella flava]
MLKVLITGAYGQLGCCIRDVAPLCKESITFVYTDFLELDITNYEKTNVYFKENEFDYCINCAAYTAVDKAEEEIDKAFSINAEGVKHLAESCLAYDVILIHVSTDFVFDGLKLGVYTEKDKPNPINTYGASKLKGEQYVQDMLDKYFIVRTSWVYSEYGQNFVKTMLRLSNERDEINVVSDQVGSPTYAGDLANFLVSLVFNKSKDFGLYHYSNLGEISWCEFAAEIFKQANNTSININSIKSKAYPTPAIRPKNSCMSKELTQQTFKLEIPYWTDSLSKVLVKLIGGTNLI